MSAPEGRVAIVTLTRALAEEPGLTMSAGVQEHPEDVDAPRDVPVSARTLKRDQQPEDVVGAVVFQCGPGSAFITGQTMVIDGGQCFH
jgi:NAD(P)-dependent dehydrogenase (short-subunit alcohol dehydrogenase family)